MVVPVAALTGMAVGILSGVHLDVLYADAAASARSEAGPPLFVAGCPLCRQPASPWHLVPVFGAVAGSGGAGGCGHHSALRGTLLPSAVALLFALAAATSESGAEAALKGWLGLPFLLAAATDLERRLIPNRLVLPFLLLALALSWAWPARGPAAAAAGAAIGFGVLLVPYLLPGGGLGAGDVKFAALMGAVLGPANVLLALLLGVTAGGVAALLLLAARRSRRQVMPYGPFLAAGALVALLWGDSLVGGYLG